MCLHLAGLCHARAAVCARCVCLPLGHRPYMGRQAHVPVYLYDHSCCNEARFAPCSISNTWNHQQLLLPRICRAMHTKVA